MDTLETVLLVLLMLDAVLLAAFVLMQQSRGADIGAAFGSGSANTLFGATGATSFLAKLTTVLAIGFFLIAFGLAYVAFGTRDDFTQLGLRCRGVRRFVVNDA